MPFDKPPSGFLNGRPVEPPEAAAKTDQVIIRQVLAAKEQNLMIEPGAVNPREVLITNVSEIQLLDFRPERHRGGLYQKPCGPHFSYGPIGVAHSLYEIQ